ncbi:MAG TPA: phosphoenolpyruvate--protein phosphotransferase [Actinomycetes bacterium]|nr:phosphoenolpyruvate--protein phosphotransferase [Actinomycetes bacterium]
MAELQGVGVSSGVVVGPVARMGGEVPVPPEGPGRDPAAEARAAAEALEAVAADLEARGQASGGDAQAVLEAQAMMARDPGLAEQVEQLAGGRTAAGAVYEAFGVYRKLLGGAGDYMAARIADLDDVRDRAVARLLGVAMPGVPDPGRPYVLVARDLAPADTATLRRDQVLALVTEEGGPTSHTAILAKSMGVPAVVACPGATRIQDGVRVLVDGGAGQVVVEPDEGLVHAAEARARARQAALAAFVGPGRTADGHTVGLLANVGGPGDVEAAVAAGAEGVGLLRTEFLFLDRSDPPPVLEQVAAYRAAFDAFPGGKVVVRTLDAGADKPLAFLDLGTEPNPALGVRGLRALRRRPELLTEQLDAVGEAAAGSRAEVWVMAPMVATAEEAAWFCAQVRQRPVAKAGVMIEIPAAALQAAEILAECDFASIGTNDLAQYAFAADRLVGALAALQNPWQPALLRLVAASAEAGRAAGKPVGVCGEAGGDPVLALVLVGLGITSLSMAPRSLADVRMLLGRHSLDDCRRLAQLALSAPDAATARTRVRGATPVLVELGL